MLAQFFYATNALFSGPLLFIPLFVDFANPIMYTSLPILLYAITDADVPKEIAEAEPKLYARSMQRVYYTNKSFFIWLIEAAYAGLLSAYVPAFLLSLPDYSGQCRSAISLSTMWLVCIICNFRLMMENHSWTILEEFGVVAMLLVLLLTTIVFTYWNNDSGGSFSWGELYGTVQQLFPAPSFWLVIMGTTIVALFPRMVVKAKNILWRPSLVRLALHNFNPTDPSDGVDEMRQSISNAYVPSTNHVNVKTRPSERVKKDQPAWKRRRSQFTTHEPSANFVMNGFTRTETFQVTQGKAYTDRANVRSEGPVRDETLLTVAL